MKLTRHLKAMTLVELLITSALIGIMMLGVVAVELAIRNTQASSRKDAQVTMEAQAVMMIIANDVKRAVGNSLNRGIDTTQSDLCIRQDTDDDPNTFTGDGWVCYNEWDHYIYRCVDEPAPMVCNSTHAGYERISTARIAQFTIAFTINEALRELNVDITLISRSSPDDPAHPITNPEYVLTTRIVPPGHSF